MEGGKRLDERKSTTISGNEGKEAGSKTLEEPGGMKINSPGLLGSSSSSSSSLPAPTTNDNPMLDLCLFVANLPSSFTDEELEHHLRSLFSRFGNISSTKAARDKKQRPFCFVQFKGLVGGEVFTQAHYLGGRSLRVERSRVRSNEVISNSNSLRATPLPSNINLINEPLPGRWSCPPPTLLSTLYGNTLMGTGGGNNNCAGAGGEMLHPTLLTMIPWIVIVDGFAEREGTRKAIFHRFKRYGYILGIEMHWDGEGKKRAHIYFDNINSAHAVVKDHDGIELWGGRLKCEAMAVNDDLDMISAGSASNLVSGLTSISSLCPAPMAFAPYTLGSLAGTNGMDPWYGGAIPIPEPCPIPNMGWVHFGGDGVMVGDEGNLGISSNGHGDGSGDGDRVGNFHKS